MLDEEFPFATEVATGGYQWVQVGEVASPGGCRIEAGDYLHEVERGELGHRSRVGFVTVRPDAIEPALFLIFAGLPPGDRGAIVEFANRFGRLGYVPESRLDKAEWWEDAIAELRHAVEVDRLLRAGDRAALAGMARYGWPAVPDSLFSFAAWAEGKRAWHFRAPHQRVGQKWGDGSEGNWDEVYPTPPEGADPRAVAAAWLDMEVNRRLLYSTRAGFVADPATGRRRFTLTPACLNGLLWLQFARSIAGEKEYGRCRECGRPFELVPRDKGRRMFCSDACKLKDYRKRKARAAELSAAGKTPKEIAAEVERDVQTVKGWISSAKKKGGGK